MNGNESAAEPSERLAISTRTSDGIGHSHESNGTGGNENGKRCAVARDAELGAAGPDRSTITTRLLETVRDRTGYPIETLGLDLDMEADLGIDSIKRVEILGKLRDEFPGLKALSDSPEMMDAMARARTLGVIVDRMTSLARAAERCDRRDRTTPPLDSVDRSGNQRPERKWQARAQDAAAAS